jgi:hypothetical protein
MSTGSKNEACHDRGQGTLPAQTSPAFQRTVQPSSANDPGSNLEHSRSELRPATMNSILVSSMMGFAKDSAATFSPRKDRRSVSFRTGRLVSRCFAQGRRLG